ncbi:alpha/beta hydrolase [Virgibacillus doumboii]|uniref:alpha/beta hydrolase n=1 Tax=Virgibacillus doumboii TaxID=2697503 RepID=UPI0013E03844|nr:alpha/beta hydrolase [Virgibacillus doumboii]
MEVKEGFFRGMNEARLFYQSFIPETSPEGAVIVVHGLGDHSGGMLNLCNKLADASLIVYAFDLRGHGKSSGTRGYIRKWNEYIEDLHAFRNKVINEIPELPLYIVSHSLGGVIALDYSLHYSHGISGLIAIAPAISYETKWSEKLLIQLMGRFKPDYVIEEPGNLDLLTQDQTEQSRLESDELRHNMVTPGLGRGLLQTIPRLMNKAHSIQLPFLLQFGLDDEMTPPWKLREFYNSIGSEEKQKYEYDALRHRPFDDSGREQFFSDMTGWLERQTEKVKK